MDIFQKDLLLIPIHLEVHWSLVSVDIPRRAITYFDSQRTLNRRCPKVSAWLPLMSFRLEQVLKIIYIDLVFICVSKWDWNSWQYSFWALGIILYLGASVKAVKCEVADSISRLQELVSINDLLFSTTSSAYCKVPAGGGCQERPERFPHRVERLFQNGMSRFLRN